MSIIVLLAAGESSRTSGMKQLYRVDNQYLINKQIKILKSYGYDVAVVLGHNSEKILSIIDEDVRVVLNENYKEGMFSSVKTAFKTLNTDRLIFCHIDRPMVDKELFEALINSKDSITTAYYNGKKAPPIMIKSSMKESLLSSTHTRLDHWIQSTNRASHICVNDERVHFNANTDEELRRYFG